APPRPPPPLPDTPEDGGQRPTGAAAGTPPAGLRPRCSAASTPSAPPPSAARPPSRPGCGRGWAVAGGCPPRRGGERRTAGGRGAERPAETLIGDRDLPPAATYRTDQSGCDGRRTVEGLLRLRP